MQILLEMFFVKIKSDKLLYCRSVTRVDYNDIDPDEIVSKTADKIMPQFIKDEYIIHSTSWRYEQVGKILLTYMIYSDFMDFEKCDLKTVGLNELYIAKSASHKKPRPEVITEINVLSHAIRHLAYLVKHSDHDRYRSILSLETLMVIDKMNEVPAGEIEKQIPY